MTAYDYFFPSKKKKNLKIKTLLCKLLSCCQALFRKIATALLGMETLSSTKQEDMVDINLKSSNAAATQSQPQSGGCAC